MSEGLPWGDSPVDIPGDEPEAPHPAGVDLAGLGWTARILAVSSLLLVAFNSHAIANWANQLPITSSTAPIITAAQSWHDKADSLGLNVVVDFVERQAEAIRKAKWGSAPDGRPAE